MNYAERARAANALAEAATDPRDKAAYRGAARMWETLARPGESTFSFEPLRRELEALRRELEALKVDAAKPIEPPQPAPRSAPAPIAQPARQFVTIEF